MQAMYMYTLSHHAKKHCPLKSNSGVWVCKHIFGIFCA